MRDLPADPTRARLSRRGQRARVAARVRALVGDDLDAPAPADVASSRSAGADGGLPAGRWRLGVAARGDSARGDSGRRGAIAVGVAALLAAIATGWWVFAARPHAVTVQTAGPGMLSTAAGSTSSASAVSVGASRVGGSPVVGSRAPGGSRAGGTPPVAPTVGQSVVPGAAPPPPGDTSIVVDVVGAVARPGLYRLPAGARVDDAIAAAGGARRGFDTSVLNLAARLSDGQQLVVAKPGAGGAGVAAGGGASDATGPGSPGTAAGPVYLNSATLEQLETLPGVGPVLAQHILDWRSQHGSFTSVGQLQDVSGIGPAKFAALNGLVAV